MDTPVQREGGIAPNQIVHVFNEILSSRIAKGAETSVDDLSARRTGINTIFYHLILAGISTPYL